MRGIRDYIAHIPNRYLEKFKTEGGLELYGDHRWSAKEMANTVVDVIEVPFFGDTPIQKGYQLFVDPTVIFNQVYQKTGAADSPFLVDKSKGYYKISKDLIIAYRENENSHWKAFGDNNLLTRIKNEVKEQPTVSGLILPATAQPKYKKGIGEVVYASTGLKEMGAKENDHVFFSELTAIDVFLNGKTYVWSKDRHIIGIEEKNNVA